MTEGPLLVEADLTDFRAGDPDLNLAAAVEAVRGYCGWHIAPVREEELTLDAVNGVVVLPTLRATGVVVVDNGTTLATDDYTLKPGVLVLQGSRGTKSGTVTVTLTHGYDDLPADVKRIALSMADTGTSPGGRLKSAGPFTYEFPDDSVDAQVLDRYRLASVS